MSQPRARPSLTASLLLPLLLGAGTSAHAEAVRYELDPVHTRVMFAVSHAGFSNALGTVSGSTGELWFDPEDWSSARLRASVPIARADLGDAKWNKAALARNLLDAERYPQASFVSTRIEPVDANHASVFGTLTLHGVAREVKLDVTLNAARRHPLPPFRRTAGFSATTTISRKAFGIDAWPSVIGDAVELRIEAEATRSRGRGDASADAPAADAPEVEAVPGAPGTPAPGEPEPRPDTPSDTEAAPALPAPVDPSAPPPAPASPARDDPAP